MYKYEDPLARSQNTREIVNKLRRDIILGKYQRGSRLIEVKLAEQLGTSRAPVRTAFQLLAQEGLVLNLPNGGTEVIGYLVKDLKDMFDLRLILEQKVLQTTFQDSSFHYRPLFDVMETFNKFKENAEKKEITRYDTAYLDITFHRSLILMSRNKPLLVTWNAMANTLQTILEITNMTSSTFQEFYDAHNELAELIIQKNKNSFDLLEFHITKAKDIIVERIKKNIHS